MPTQAIADSHHLLEERKREEGNSRELPTKRTNMNSDSRPNPTPTQAILVPHSYNVGEGGARPVQTAILSGACELKFMNYSSEVKLSETNNFTLIIIGLAICCDDSMGKASGGVSQILNL